MTGRPSPEELSRIESELLERLTSTRIAYEEAKAQADTLSKVSADLGLNHPDGRVAVRNATRLEQKALQSYANALKAFNDFILRGQTP